MITAIRRTFKSTAIKVILGITILAVSGIFYLPEALKRTANSPWIAMVNGEEISYNDFARKAAITQERINFLRAQYGQYAEYFFQAMGIPADPKVFAVEQLVQETLLNQANDAVGLVAGHTYMAEKLSNPLFVQQQLSDIIPVGLFDQSGGINGRALHNYLHRIGMTGSDFEHKIMRSLERRALLDIVTAASYVPEIELKQQFIAQYVDKTFTILTLPFKKFLKEAQTKEISAQELQSYFDANNAATKKYWIPEKRSGIAWQFKPEAYGISIADELIAAYYEDHKASLFSDEPAKVQIRYILFAVTDEAQRQAVLAQAQKTRESLLQDKKAFASVAQELSADKESASKGGLLPAFARGKQEPAIDKASFLLKEDGDISEVIQVAQGYALVQREKRLAPTYKSLASVKKEIEKSLTAQKFNELFARDMQEILDQHKGDEAALIRAFKDKGGKEEKITAITADESKWASRIFSIAAKDEASFFLDEGTGVVVLLTDIQARYLPSLEAVKEVVANDIYEERAAQELVKKAGEALQEAKGKSLKEVQALFGGELETIADLSKKDTSKIEALKKKGYPVEQLLQLEKVGAVVDFGHENDACIVRLEKVESYTNEQYQTKKNELSKELEQPAKRLFVEGFVASLSRSAKIETNESLITLNEN